MSTYSKIEKGVNRMTVAEMPPASAVSFDKRKRNVNRMTVAEVPPASAVSFDQKGCSTKVRI